MSPTKYVDHAIVQLENGAPTSSGPFSGMMQQMCPQEITDFFLNYLRNDNLGVIANAHLVWADLSEGGARCEECLQLAALHSKAVDFPKSGVPAEIPKASKPSNLLLDTTW